MKDEQIYNVVRTEWAVLSDLGETVPLNILEKRKSKGASCWGQVWPLGRICRARVKSYLHNKPVIITASFYMRKQSRRSFLGHTATGRRAGISPQVCEPQPRSPILLPYMASLFIKHTQGERAAAMEPNFAFHYHPFYSLYWTSASDCLTKLGLTGFLQHLQGTMSCLIMEVAISQSALFWHPHLFWEVDPYEHYKVPFYRWGNCNSGRSKMISITSFCVRPFIFTISFYLHNHPILCRQFIHSFIHLQAFLDNLCRYKQWTK